MNRKDVTLDELKKTLEKDTMMGEFKWKIQKVSNRSSIPRTHCLSAPARILKTDEILAMANLIEDYPCGMNIVNDGGRITIRCFR